MILFNDIKRKIQLLKPELDKAVDDFFESGQYILGERVLQFEKEFAKYLGSKYAIGVGSGFDAIEIALLSLGICKDDEVITTPLSAAATALAIKAVGARPVFVDIDDSLCIDSKKIEEKITRKTRAILPVHLYGNQADIVEINSICQKYSLFLIEDAAQAHGSMFNGKKLGTFGELGCFSFYPTKNLGCFGDGGMIVTNNGELYEKCRMIRNGGQISRYEHKVFGIDSRLDEIQAAFLSVQLPYLEEYNKNRSHSASAYYEMLGGTNDVKFVKLRDRGISNHHLFVIETEKRDELASFLKKHDIPTLIHYLIPIHKQECFSEFNELCLPIVEQKVKRILSLPMHPFLEKEDIAYICTKIREFYSDKNKIL